MKTRASLLVLIWFLLIGGCTPIRPSLATFTPPEDSPFKITFNYPSEWEWKKHSYDLMVADIYPNARKSEIWIGVNVNVSALPKTTMTDRMNLFLNTKTTVPNFQILDDKTVQIDGNDARWFVTRSIRENYISEDIFVLSEDRFYLIGIRYSESETNRRFHDEFEAMIESIQFLP